MKSGSTSVNVWKEARKRKKGEGRRGEGGEESRRKKEEKRDKGLFKVKFVIMGFSNWQKRGTGRTRWETGRGQGNGKKTAEGGEERKGESNNNK